MPRSWLLSPFTSESPPTLPTALLLAARGLTTRDIAERLFISPKTADHHIQHVYVKTGVSTRAAAALWAMQNGIIRWPYQPWSDAHFRRGIGVCCGGPPPGACGRGKWSRHSNLNQGPAASEAAGVQQPSASCLVKQRALARWVQQPTTAACGIAMYGG